MVLHIIIASVREFYLHIYFHREIIELFILYAINKVKPPYLSLVFGDINSLPYFS